MTHYIPHRSSTVVPRVIETVAEADDVDPVSMAPPLADVVDPDALNDLVDHGSDGSDRTLEVRFHYRGHEVVVTDDGDVSLE
ncbi:HalOD1 output domain-containing protein [Haloarchaeobius amylolyticus]|uniref:HalOD1 output domain-containing protein n=1 Tax=Haloarchaeobius amylolyticus TaxID=1198296 RepID=A0ABD6BC54_9EURY